MKFIYIILIFVTTTLNLDLLGQELTVGTILNTEESENGYTLFSSKFDTYLIDNCGFVVNKWTSDFRNGLSAYLLEDGSLLRAGNRYDIGYGLGGIIEKFNWEGERTWSYTLFNDTLFQHHDIEPLPNGNVLAVCYHVKDSISVWNAGARDTIEYSSTAIIEIEPVSSYDGAIVWEWYLWDHLVQEVDSSRANFGVVKDHPELFDINLMFFPDIDGPINPTLNIGSDWMHINSIDYNAVRDEILISSRDHNEIFIIDHSTSTEEAASHNGGNRKHGGDILFRFGNRQNYGGGIDPTFYGQHHATWISEGLPHSGKIMVFNNGFRFNDMARGFSTADVLKPNIDEHGNYLITGEVEFLPQINMVEDQLFYSEFMGSAQMLTNGNILICDSHSGRIYEYNQSNELVWHYINPLTLSGPNTQGQPSSGLPLIFRATRYSPWYAGFIGKDLTPKYQIEIEGDPESCSIIPLSTEETKEYFDISIYPNPSSGRIYIESNKPIEYISLYDLNGIILLSYEDVDHLDLMSLTSGLYILELMVKGRRTYRTRIVVY